MWVEGGGVGVGGKNGGGESASLCTHLPIPLSGKFKNLVLFGAKLSHTAGFFYSMKPTRSIAVLPLNGMLVHHRLPLSILSGFPNSSPVPIYTPGWEEAL